MYPVTLRDLISVPPCWVCRASPQGSTTGRWTWARRHSGSWACIGAPPSETVPEIRSYSQDLSWELITPSGLFPLSKGSPSESECTELEFSWTLSMSRYRSMMPQRAPSSIISLISPSRELSGLYFLSVSPVEAWIQTLWLSASLTFLLVMILLALSPLQGVKSNNHESPECYKHDFV